MEHIGGRLAKIQQTIRLIGADPATQKGFTQVPNFILTNSTLSAGAKLAYAMLLKYGWQNNFCFPGQIQLGKDMAVTERQVRRYLDELEGAGYLKIIQRGLNQTNIYELSLVVRGKHSKPTSRSDRTNLSGQDRT